MYLFLTVILLGVSYFYLQFIDEEAGLGVVGHLAPHHTADEQVAAHHAGVLVPAVSQGVNAPACS